ncbi:ABC transporter ATP-binding protein [bacterium]|nr:ABC transporter ATP-binding protein [bacterium]
MRANPQRGIVLAMDDVSASFAAGGESRIVLREVSLRAERGELILLLGPSGSGKTTLLTIAAGLRPPGSGTLSLFGRDIRSYRVRELQQIRASRIGFVFQDFKLIEGLTVRQNVALPLRLAGWSGTRIKDRIETLLGEVDMLRLGGRYPRSLSQGQRQRVALLRAMANGGELILADEPTASLDRTSSLEVIRRLAWCAEHHRSSVIVASHDLRMVDSAARVYRIDDGSLAEWHRRPVVSGTTKEPQSTP